MYTTFGILYAAMAACVLGCDDAAAAAASPPVIVFDGRVPANFTLAQFNSKNNLFSSTYVVGANQTLSSMLKFTDGASSQSLYDREGKTKPVEVTINDRSIFAPSPSNVQVGFRRTELMIASNSGKDDSTTGVKTLHFSLSRSQTRPLNTKHEYQLCFLEDGNFANNQFVLKTGSIIGMKNVSTDSLTLFGNTAKFGDVLFTTPFVPNTFHNFALHLDFTRNMIQVFYSKGLNALQPVTQPRNNDLSGQGQYHFGVLKKGLNGNGDPKKGTQESGINEGIVFGGIFMENNSAGQ